MEVKKEAYNAYLKLKDALAAEGVKVDLDSARRSVAEQQRTWDDFMEEYGEAYTKRTVATPGFSEHHTGLALDLYLSQKSPLRIEADFLCSADFIINSSLSR